MEQRERWKVFEADKKLEQINHILWAKGWRIEAFYDFQGIAYDAYPVKEHGHKPPKDDLVAQSKDKPLTPLARQ